MSQNIKGFWQRFTALLRKEIRQMLRDRSNLLVGLLLPCVLILLFGYGLSLDVKNAPVAIVLEDQSPTAKSVVQGLEGSRYIRPVLVQHFSEAEQLMRQRQVDAIVRIPVDFSRQLNLGQAQIQVVLHGIDTNTAWAMDSYINAAINQWAAQQLDRHGLVEQNQANVVIAQRVWFNAANTSTWYLVPGLLVLVMTLIGAFLTSLLIAREWERGTFEALFVTPVQPLEIILSKFIPYLMIGMIDLGMCILAAYYLFHVPIHGSLLLILLASFLYLCVSLALGLAISAKARNQFVASQMALLTSFMPAMMLSGFVFDLHNIPWAIQIISRLIPATYFMEMIKTLFLAGNNHALVLRNCLVLVGFTVLLLYAIQRMMRKRLD